MEEEVAASLWPPSRQPRAPMEQHVPVHVHVINVHSQTVRARPTHPCTHACTRPPRVAQCDTVISQL